MKICIGITSYLPDDSDKRKERIKRLTNLISQCNTSLGLDVLIIAQNWKDFDISYDYQKIIERYDKALGITQARVKLRELFLRNNYDYIMFMDDDSVLTSNQSIIDNYINEIKKGLYDFYYPETFYLRFSCVSRRGLIKVSFDQSVNAERGTGWEDVIFNKMCLKRLSFKKLTKEISAISREHYCKDTCSTWDCLNNELQQKNSRSVGAIKKRRGI